MTHITDSDELLDLLVSIENMLLETPEIYKLCSKADTIKQMQASKRLASRTNKFMQKHFS